ncbi:MAG TPA: superoxide dismutase family protein [Candidatus Saccharibacteria bacterium]|nr:superoxide dismutase family protein [Candidatus Saccharibacteria bacterium]
MNVQLKAEGLKKTKSASAIIAGQGIEGVAEFTEYDVDGWKYVHVRVMLHGKPNVLTAGHHAVHIHEKGDCECDGFKCAGGHFDPGPNGNSDPDANHGYHAGDLPNIRIDENGDGILEAITSRITLSDGPVSILSKESAPEGTSIMVHANPDPHTPGETGSGHSGGPRLACGKIKPIST